MLTGIRVRRPPERPPAAPHSTLPAPQDMHAYWRWYTWLDPLHYAWTALVLNNYDGTDILYNGVTVWTGGFARLFAGTRAWVEHAAFTHSQLSAMLQLQAIPIQMSTVERQT